jgi:uncharacterized glyoxalase superfamily protein PhnB
MELTPYLAVDDARVAIAWYTEALAARSVGDPYVLPDDRIGHAELDIGGARVFVSDARPELGVVPPDPDRHTVTLVLTVPDVDLAVDRAADCGASVERPARDEPYGRTGVIVDPYGHRWMLQGRPHDDGVHHGPRPGDTVYLTLQVPDGARARDFYEAVLGWSLAPGRVADGFEDEAVTPMVGIHGGRHAQFGAVPMYAVDDIEVAIAAVRTAGGEAGDIERRSYGLSAQCRDDQGLPFWLGQLD